MKITRYLIVLMLLLAQIVSAQQPMQFVPEAAELYQNGMQAMRMRRLTIAREQFQELCDKFPLDVHTSLAKRQLVTIFYDSNDYEKAIALLQEMIKNDQSEDNRRYAREELLDLLLELQRFRQGIEILEELRQQEPDNIALSRQLAKFYLQTGRKDEAWLLLESLMERSGAGEAFKDLLDLAVRGGEVEKLLQALENRRSRYRSHDFADYSADCYIALGRKDKAIEVLMGVENLKDHLGLQQKLADLLIGSGRYDEAFNILETSIKIIPGDWAVIRKMGHCRFMQKKKQEAIEIWRSPLSLPYMQRRDFYQDLASILIEHQLNEEALNTYYEARQTMNQPTVFSEEIAVILEAMGRKSEAIEEYIRVFSSGAYRGEVFDRLYKAYQEGFALEARLQAMNSDGNFAIMQALLEFYFRKADLTKVNSVITIVSSAAGALDEIFYERLNQEALLSPAEFHFLVAEKVIEARMNSSLALRLSMLLLEMGILDDRWLVEAYEVAEKAANVKSVADADLKAHLLLKLAEYAFQKRHDIKSAEGFLNTVLQTDLNRAAPERAYMAAILQSRLYTISEKFSHAADLLAQTEKQLGERDEDIFNPDPVSLSEIMAASLLEKSWMFAHEGEYQKALLELKKIIEDMTESEWANDALELANFIMRRSITDFSLIRKTMQAERFKYKRKYSEAVALLEETIKENPSAQLLITEMQAEIVMLKSFYLESADVIKEIDKFATENTESFKVADLWEIKWRLMKRMKSSRAEIREHLQTFVDHFPSDLRSGRFKKILASWHDQAENNESGEKQ